jgi:ribosome-binding protein aMBF1 (putative translation factor)
VENLIIKINCQWCGKEFEMFDTRGTIVVGVVIMVCPHCYKANKITLGNENVKAVEHNRESGRETRSSTKVAEKYE